MNTDFVITKVDSWGLDWFFVRKGVWTTNLEEAKVFPNREAVEKKLASYTWPSAKYETVEEARARRQS